MRFSGNLLKALMSSARIGLGGMAGEILDAQRFDKAFYGCEGTPVE